MNRKPVQEWLLLFTYGFVLILITMHSGYLCKKLLYVARQFLPVVFAGFLAFVLNRPYKFVQILYEKRFRFTKRLSRTFALLTVYLGLLGTITAALRFALPRFLSGLQQFIENREDYVRAFQTSMILVIERLGIEKLDLTPIFEGLTGYLGRLDAVLEEILPRMARMTTGAFRIFALTGIILVLSAYMLYDKERIQHQIGRIYHAFVPERYAASGYRFIRMSMDIFDNFVAGQGLESLILGSLCFVGMFVLGLEYSGFVSLVVGLTAFIPFFGAYIGGGLGTLLLLFISMKKAVTFLIFFIVLQQIENNFIYPRVVGKRTGLPGLLVIVAVTVGGGLFGVIGMIFSVPTATLLYQLTARAVKSRENKKDSTSDERKS